MLESLWSGFSDENVHKIVTSLISILVILITGYFARILARHRFGDPEAQYHARKWINNAVFVFSFLVVIAIYSDQLGGLTVFLSAVGVGITFALQEVIASAAGWIAVTVGRFYRTGDRVQLGGIKGDVIDISVLRTTLMEIGEWLDADLYTGRMVRIANSFVFKEPVFNYTANFPFLWDEIKIPIRHGSDAVLARGILQKVAEEANEDSVQEAAQYWQGVKNVYFIGEVNLEPQVTMKITDNWLEFTVRYIVDYRYRRLTKDRMHNQILAEINRNPERLVIASTTVALVESPPLDITVRKPPEKAN